MQYVSRADWGARPPRSRLSLRHADVTHFVLHHAAATYVDGRAAMRSIQAFHQDTRGWADYGYNFGVWEDGTIYEGRGFGAVGAHTSGWNSRAVAVCYMGDGRHRVPDAAKRALMQVADEADRYFGRRLTRVAHRDVGRTSCPGDRLYRWWNSGDPRPVVPDVRDGWRRHLDRMMRRR